MRKLARLFGWGLAGIFAIVILATILTARRGEAHLWPPVAGSPTAELFVVSHGYHAGIAVSRSRVAEVAGRQGNSALIAVAQRFSAYPWIEIGWGDEGFYTSVPDAASLTFALALRALFRPGNPSVVHVVGLTDQPRAVFPVADIVKVELSPEGLSQLLAKLDQTFARSSDQSSPLVLGKGLYGPSLFYRAVESFHIFNVCNHWVARLLSAAGLPTTPVLATLPPGLLFDLKWRSGLVRLPPASAGARS